MMEAKDWMSGIIGAAIFALGLIPILESFKVLNLGFSKVFEVNWFTAAIPFVLAIFGFYLAMESITELMNSNHIGWLSFFIGAAIMVVGLLPALQKFGIGPGLFGLEIPAMIYQIIFIVEGFFLMIAMFAMEL
jgi:hypothetical protein